MASPSGSVEPEPSRVTVSPTFTVWLFPASAVGARLCWTTRMVTVSISESSTLSVMVSRNTRVSALPGATNVGDDTVWLDIVTMVPDIWLHEYDMASPSGSVEPEPSRVTVSPTFTVWFAPASVVGGLLYPETRTSITRWLSVPNVPVEVMLTVYACLVGTASRTRLEPVILKEAESPPVPMPYVRFWRSRKGFWDEMLPTVPGASLKLMVVLSGTIYQAPKFWLNCAARSNMFHMLITFETSQDDMLPLKEEAPLNIRDMSVTLETSQDDMLPLKEEKLNMPGMLVTLETFQDDMSPLKEEASLNMPAMSVTLETSQDDMSPLKEEASLNMPGMLVTLETFQDDMSPLKEEASLNMPAMSVTLETSQDDMSPLKEEAPLNMPAMSVTLERSGTSVALYTMLLAPLNANLIVSHRMSPHWSMETSLRALVESPDRLILVKSPDMRTV